MALIAAFIAVLVVVVSLWWVLKRDKHAIDLLHGPPTVPVFGNCFDLAKHNREEAFGVLNSFNKKYFPLYRTWVMKIPVIHPLDPKYVESVLTSSQHITKSFEYNFISEWLGDGLLTSTGSKWHSRRKLLTPTFHFKILEEFLPVFHENTEIFISKLKEFLGKKDGVDIVPLVTLCALDIICETAMGTSVNAQKEDSEYVRSIHELGDLIIHRVLRPWLYPKFLYTLTPTGRRHYQLIDLLKGFTKKVIRERRQEIKIEKLNISLPSSDTDTNMGSRKKTAFLDLLLRVSEEQGNLTDEDIREEVDTFMFEGHDTTATAMSWAMHFLGCNPEVQDKCVSEMNEIFEGSDRTASMSDLNNMKYMERVIKETLRLKPSVYIIGRKVTQNLKLGNNEFPNGTIINIHIYSIHRNPHIFPDPEKFDPDRFLPENCVGRHPYAYIPFSAGPRNCIGQKFAMLEMKSLLSTVVRNFRLESCNPIRDDQAVPDLILRPKNGLQIRILPRT